MVLAIVVSRGLVVDHAEYPDRKNHKGRSHHPTELEINVRLASGHRLHIFAQSSDSVEPSDRYHLEEGEVHDRDGGGVMVDQLEEVDSPLKNSVEMVPAKVSNCCTCVTLGKPQIRETTQMIKTKTS